MTRFRERRGLFYGDEGNWCSRKHNSSLCNYPEAVKASCHRLAKGNKDLPAPVRLNFLVGTSMRLQYTAMCIAPGKRLQENDLNTNTANNPLLTFVSFDTRTSRTYTIAYQLLARARDFNQI